MNRTGRVIIPTLLVMLMMLGSSIPGSLDWGDGPWDGTEEWRDGADAGTDGTGHHTSGANPGSAGSLEGTRDGGGTTIHVDADGGNDTSGNGSADNPYRTVARGVEAASGAGGGEPYTVLVHPGTYRENVEVNRTMSIRSFSGDPDDTILEANIPERQVFLVEADSVNISGLTITGTGFVNGSAGTALRIRNCEYFTVENCVLEDNYAAFSGRYVNHTTFSGNTIRNNEKSGVFFYGSSDNLFQWNTVSDSGDVGIEFDHQSERNTVSDNTISGCSRGIQINYISTDCTITRNRVDDAEYAAIDVTFLSNDCGISSNTVTGSGSGIYLSQSDSCIITNNTASLNTVGIYLTHSENLDLVNNTMGSNTYNLAVNGGTENELRHDIGTDNTVNGKPVYYLVDERDRTLPKDAGYVALVSCDNITVRDLELSDAMYGVFLAYTDNSRVENVTTSDTIWGIRLLHSEGNTLRGNDVRKSSPHGEWFPIGGNGIHLTDSPGTVVEGNTAMDNQGDGILVGTGSHGCVVRNNTADSNGDTGIHVIEYLRDIVIEGNTVRENLYGITVTRSYSNLIRNNTVQDNERDGLEIYDGYEHEIHNNTISGNGWAGLSLGRTRNNVLTGNVMTGNGKDFDLFAYYPEEYVQTIDDTNTAGGKRILYWSNLRDTEISGDGGGGGDIDHLIVVNCTNVTISDLVLHDHGTGLDLISVNDSRVLNVTAEDNDIGIRAFHCANLDIGECTGRDNGQRGILVEGSENVTLRNNSAESNSDRGILLYMSVDCSITGNVMSGNAVNFEITGSGGGSGPDGPEEDRYYLHRIGDGVPVEEGGAGDVNMVGGSRLVFLYNATNITVTGEVGYLMMIRCRNATLEDMMIRNKGNGIIVRESPGITLENVTSTDNTMGAVIMDSANVSVRNCTFSDNAGSGLELSNCNGSLVTGTTADANGKQGISILASRSCEVVGNRAMGNGEAGLDLHEFTWGMVTDNEVTGNEKFGLFLHTACENTTVRRIDADGNGIYGIGALVSSANLTIEDCSVSQCGGAGIYLHSTRDSFLRNLTASLNGEYGISLEYLCIANRVEGNLVTGNGIDGIIVSNRCQWNMIVNNTIEDNLGSGINFPHGCEWNDVHGNHVSGNDGYGIMIDRSENNTIYDNMFENNLNALDLGSNRWNVSLTPSGPGGNVIGGDHLGGNFWSDYSGNDTDGDGIGDTDTPYTSGGGIATGGDMLPLVLPPPPLAISLCDSRDPVKPGSTFDWMVNITNIIDEPLTNITVTVAYPDGVSFLSAEPTPDEGGSDSLWTFLSIPVNGSVTITISVRANAGLAHGTPLPFSVTARCDQGPTVEGSETTTIALPELSITISDGPDPVQKGTTTTLTVQVINTGEVNATNVRMTGTYHGKMAFVASDPSPDSGNNLWMIGSLQPGESANITVTLEVDISARDGNVFTNSFMVESDEGSTAMEGEETTIAGPTLVVWKLGVIEEEPTDYILNYTFEITNTGSGYASNFIIIDTYDPWTTYLSSDLPPNEGNNTWYIPRVESGETFRFNLSVSVDRSIPNATWVENRAILTYHEGYQSSMKSGTYFIVDEPPVVPRNITIALDPLPHPLSAPPGNIVLPLSGNITIIPNGTVHRISIFLDGTFLENISLGDQTNDTGHLQFSQNLTLPGNLTEGNHTLTVNVTLETGEADEVTVNFTFEPEAVHREIIISFDTFTERVPENLTISFSGAVQVIPEGTIQEISVNGQHIGSKNLYWNESGIFRGNVTFDSSLEEGNHSIELWVVLASGETAYSNRTCVYKASTKISIIIHTVTVVYEKGRNDTLTLYFQGRTEPQSEIKGFDIFVDQTLLRSKSFNQTPDSFGANIKDLPLPGNLGKGDHTLLIRVTLVDGEVGENSTTFLYTPETGDTTGDDGEGGGLLPIVLLLIIILIIIGALIAKRSREQAMKEKEEYKTPDTKDLDKGGEKQTGTDEKKPGEDGASGKVTEKVGEKERKEEKNPDTKHQDSGGEKDAGKTKEPAKKEKEPGEGKVEKAEDVKEGKSGVLR